MRYGQGQTGRFFQIWVGSGSGIGKNFGFGSGSGSGTGIDTVYLINRVFSGNENIDRVFLETKNYCIFYAPFFGRGIQM